MPKKTSRRITVTVTEGSINNIYLSIEGFDRFFPADSFGGATKNECGTSLILHVRGIPDTVLTDIAGDKQIFRGRAWCRRFYTINGLEAGDRVIIEKISDYEYNVYPEEII